MLYALLYIRAATGATYSCAGGNLSCRLSAPLAEQTRQPVSVYLVRRPPNYEPDCGCYSVSDSYIASSSRSII